MISKCYASWIVADHISGCNDSSTHEDLAVSDQGFFAYV